MPLIKLTRKEDNKRVDVNTDAIKWVEDNGQGQPATLRLTEGDELEVNESAQSVRGYVKKAEAASSED